MKRYALAALAALSIAIPSVSQATTINVTSYGFAMGSKDGVLTTPGPFNGTNAAFGQFVLNGVNVTTGNTPVTFYTYCIDLFNGLALPGLFNVQPLSSVVDATKTLNVTKILSNVTPTNADQSAAVQLAIWEVLFDTNAVRNVSAASGQFYVTGGSSNPAAQTLANGYLASLSTWSVPVGTSATVLYSQSNQSQVFLTPVPEAGTWMMMIAGFGVAGVSMRRRRSTAAPSLV